MIALDDRVAEALAAGAYVAFNMSGGKDSGAAAVAVNHHLDRIGHPAERRLAIHADLGRAEWRETAPIVERQAKFVGLPLTVVARNAGDLVQRWEQRFANGLARYVDLLTYNLIGPWSSPSLRFCTSELKAQVIGPHLARQLAGQTIIQVVGIRRDESANRRLTPISKIDPRYAKPGNRAGTAMMLWHPIVDWSTEQVFGFHEELRIPLHPAYTAGCSRVSCAFCIMQSVRDAQVAASIATNVDLYLHLVALEAQSTFSFWPDRWLADVAPPLLGSVLTEAIGRAKRLATDRQTIESAMPSGLRYQKGWPVRVPSLAEAEAIAEARRAILSHHGQPVRYPTPETIIGRFADLMAERAMREAA